MPNTDHYSDLPVPTYSEDPNGPVAFSNLRDALAPHIVLFATTTADRDTRYADAPDGTIVSSSTSATVWKKVAGSWITLFSDTGNVSLSAAAWEPDATDIDSYYRIVNGICSLYVHFTYTGDDKDAGGNGNIADVTVLALPTAARPIRYQTPTASSSAIFMGAEIYATGGVRCSYILAGSTLTNGSTVSLNATYAVA